MRYSYFYAAVASVGLMLGALTVGCEQDQTLSKKESVQVKRDGTEIRQTEKVTRKPDGTIVRESERDVDRD